LAVDAVHHPLMLHLEDSAMQNHEQLVSWIDFLQERVQACWASHLQRPQSMHGSTAASPMSGSEIRLR
jgi:hypothetical protein